MSADRIDLGSGHSFTFFGWAPDRELNPKHADLPDLEHAGLIERHMRPDGVTPCEGALHFRIEPHCSRLWPGRPTWVVESLDPLTLSPSVLCNCGVHGFIRAGRWVNA